MTTPTDYTTTVWASIVTDMGDLPCGPDVLPPPTFDDVAPTSPTG